MFSKNISILTIFKRLVLNVYIQGKKFKGPFEGLLSKDLSLCHRGKYWGAARAAPVFTKGARTALLSHSGTWKLSDQPRRLKIGFSTQNATLGNAPIF